MILVIFRDDDVNSVDKAIKRFAVTYADQNERDHQALLEAIRDGKIEAYREP